MLLRSVALYRPIRALLLLCAALLLVPTAAARGKKKDGKWPAVTREEREVSQVPGNPDAAAIVLRQSRQAKILPRADDWVNIMEIHRRIKVLTERGKQYAEIRIPAQKYSRVSQIEGRTLKPDGTEIPLPDDQIFEEVALQVGSVVLKQWVFHFPAVEPGDILDYRYVRHDDFLLFIDPWFFEGPEYTVSSQVTQAVPSGVSYTILCALCGGAQPEISDWREGSNEGKQYSLELNNLPGYRGELLMPPAREVSPHLEMVLRRWTGIFWSQLGRQDDLFTDWASVTRWATKNYEEATKKWLGDLDDVVAGWIEGIDDPKARVEAILRHVQEDFAYVPYRQVIGASRPLNRILEERYADNEEKAVLLQAALSTQGMESHIALVAGIDFGSVNPKFFSLSQFSHAVVLLPTPEGEPMLLDPTISHSPFDFVSWRNSGAPYLLLDGDGQLGELPKKAASGSTAFEVTVAPQLDGKARLEITATLEGEDAIDLRQVLVPASGTARESELVDWLEDARSGMHITSVEVEGLDLPEEPLTIHASAEASGLVTLAEDAVAVQACVLSCYDSNPLGATRTYPFFLDYTWRERQVVKVIPPEGMVAAEAPPGATARYPAGTYNLRCSVDAETGGRCTRTLSMKRGRWAAAEAPRMHEMFDKVVAADHTMIVMKPAPAP